MKRRLVSVFSGILAGTAGVAVITRHRRTNLVGRRRHGAGSAADIALAERVRAEVIGSQPMPMSITVRRGIVTLRGEVDELVEIGDLDARARRVDGVRDITNLLRLRQGQGAPV